MSMPMPPGTPGPARGPMPGAPSAPPPSVPTKRNTRIYLLLAVAAAVLAAVVVLLSSGSAGGTFVYKAKEDIAARAKLNEGMFEVVEVAEDAVVSGAYKGSSKDDLAGKVDWNSLFARYPLTTNMQLTQGAAGTGAELDRELDPGERLISISAQLSNSVGGTLQVGDLVDVYAVADLGGNDLVANLIIADVKIVATTLPSDQLDAAAQRQASESQAGTDSDRNNYLPGDALPGTYTLLIKDPTVAARLAVLDEGATLFLAYRAPGAETAFTSPITLREAICRSAVVGTGLSPTAPSQVPLACEGIQ